MNGNAKKVLEIGCFSLIEKVFQKEYTKIMTWHVKNEIHYKILAWTRVLYILCFMFYKCSMWPPLVARTSSHKNSPQTRLSMSRSTPLITAAVRSVVPSIFA